MEEAGAVQEVSPSAGAVSARSCEALPCLEQVPSPDADEVRADLRRLEG